MRTATGLLVLGLLSAPLVAACKKSDPGAENKPAPAAPQAAKPAAPALPAYAPRVEVAVTEEGFVPGRIPARADQPLTLAITRKVERTCATEIMFAGQEGKTDLPVGKTVEVTYTPKANGEVKFGCAMGMMIGGVLVVE